MSNTVSTETVETFTQSWMTRAWKQLDPTVVDELIAEEHLSVGAGPPIEGREGWRGFVETFTGALSDIDITVDDQVIQDDRVASRWSGTMVHRASGTPVTLSGHLMLRIENGQAVEGWNSIDFVPMLMTLGYIQPDVMDRLFA